MKTLHTWKRPNKPLFRERVLCAAIGSILSTGAWAVVTGPIDPVVTNVPKYVIPMVIPPEMPKTGTTEPCPVGSTCPLTDYNIAVRQFQQQILPGGIWNALNGRRDAFGPTTVWSYGAAADPIPNGYGTIQPKGVAPVPAAQSSFNYPAFTIETKSQKFSSVRWINELVTIDPLTGKPYSLGDKRRTALPHLLAVDRTLHFANPEKLPCANPTTGAKLPGATNCRPYVDPLTPDPRLGQPYNGPVPMVVHVHGAEVGPSSDGFTESWWLPAGFDPLALNTPPLSVNYATVGSHYDQDALFSTNSYPGSAVFNYENYQPAATLWYHDHTLGMTANNVYAGPAGFWLVRGDYTAPNAVTTVTDQAISGVLPGENPGGFSRPTNPNILYGTQKGCDPNFDAVCRANIREIPIALQDRSFNSDGSLFYPQTRAFFDGGNVVPYLPASNSDVSPIHNPEFFGNMIVVNGSVWPSLDVVPQRYRLRLLAGADSRTFNLSMWAILPGAIPPNQNSPTYWSDLKTVATEVPFYQIGAEQGFLPKVVKIATGTATPLPGDGTEPVAVCTAAAAAVPATATTPAKAAVPPSNPSDPNCQRGLLMAPAERADVIVDFTALPPGTLVRVINTGPDVPFNGFPIAAIDLANPAGTGQVMEFKVIAPTATTRPDDSTLPAQLVMSSEPPNTDLVKATRRAALIEDDSKKLCVTVAPTGAITVVGSFTTAQANLATACSMTTPPSLPFGPTEVFVGTMAAGVPKPQPWVNPVTEAPTVGDSEIWEIYNYTVDAHPMHLHAARVQVVNRETLATDPVTGLPAVPAAGTGVVEAPLPTEAGYKDSIIALPGKVTRIKAKFEIAGLYTWHCHIVEHEDNEMMVPICIKGAATDTACAGTPGGGTPWPIAGNGVGLAY